MLRAPTTDVLIWYVGDWFAFERRFGLNALPIWQVRHFLLTSMSGGRWSPQIASRYTEFFNRPIVQHQYRQILGLPWSFGLRDLRAAYRQAMLEWHPDRHATDPSKYDLAEEKSKQINAAYEHFRDRLNGRDKITIPRTQSSGSASRPERRSKRRRQSQRRPTDHMSPKYKKGFPDPSVIEVFVESSNLFSVGYDRDSRVLYVKFKRRNQGTLDLYKYHSVPPEVFQRLLSASSKGRFLQGNIAFKYRYDRLGAW